MATDNSVPPPEDAGDDEDPPPPYVKLRELFVAFTQMSLMSFGGGLTAWARRVLVEDRKWLTDDQFMHSLAVVQILPGPNTIKLAVYVGAHLRGAAGAFMAVLGLVGAPLALVLALGVFYFRAGRIEWLENILQGLGVCAAGMAFSLALKLFTKHMQDPLFVAFGLLSFVLIAFVKLQMLPTVICLGVISVIFYRNRLNRHAALHPTHTPPPPNK